MRKYFIFVILALITSLSFAETMCGRQPNKAKQDACYKQLVFDRKEALEEYHESIMGSTRIPAEVKAQVDKDYRSFMRNINNTCPDQACVAIAMMEQMKDMMQDTKKYTTGR